MRNEDWKEQAACRGQDIEMWDAGNENIDVPAAKLAVGLQICKWCPVRTDCLDEAMSDEAGDGAHRATIRGGLTAVERHRLRRALTRRTTARARLTA